MGIFDGYYTYIICNYLIFILGKIFASPKSQKGPPGVLSGFLTHNILITLLLHELQ